MATTNSADRHPLPVPPPTHAWPPLQERDAARKRAQADLKRAEVASEMQRLQQTLEAMQQARAAQQEAVRQELERQKLQLQVELQVGGGCAAGVPLACTVSDACVTLTPCSTLAAAGEVPRL